MSLAGEQALPARRPVSVPPVALGVAAAAAAALWLAKDAGVAGPGAVPNVVRTVAACVLVFGGCGWAATRALLPEALRPYWPLFLFPVGASICGLTLTALGYLNVPFRPALVLVLAGGVVAAALVERRARCAVRGAQISDLVAVAVVAGLILAIALLPTFRAGFTTVTGTGADAHQVAGYATFVQHNDPGDVASEYPLDFVRFEWESRYPIFYGVAAVSSVAGLEPWQTMMTVGAFMLAVAAAGFFVLAIQLGVGSGAALLAMGLAGLDRQVLHVALHPYHNQGWGLMTMPFALALGFAWARERSPRTLVLLLIVMLLAALAYPLMLPFPLLGIAAAWVVEREGPLDPRRLWRGPVSLLWLLPLGALAVGPLRAAVEKMREFIRLLFDLDQALPDWRGDVREYAVFGEFFGLPRAEVWLAVILLVAVAAAAGYGLWRAPRGRRLAFAVMLVPALVAAGLFREIEAGEYIYFKILAFAGPLALVTAVAGLARAWRPLGIAGLTLLCVFCFVNVRREVSLTFDQLTPEQVQLRHWSAQLPPGASVRLDTPPRTQLWDAFFLSDRPVGSRAPNLFYWHVPYTRGADYALDRTLRPPPRGHVGAPVFANGRLRLWKLSPAAGKDTTSQAQESYLGRIKRGDVRLRRIFRRGIPDPTR